MIKFGKILTLTAFSAVMTFSVGDAIAAKEKMMSLNPEDLYKVSDGPVKIYGQTLEPHKVKVDDDGVYKWKQLKDIMPELLPGAKSSSKSPQDLCDHVVTLTELYAIEADKAENFIVNKLVDKYGNEHPFGDEVLEFAVSDRLTSASNKKLNELLKALSGEEEKVLVSQDAIRKHQTMLYVHDAALNVCSDHASEKGYLPILSYVGEDAGYDADKDPKWDEFEEKIKSE